MNLTMQDLQPRVEKGAAWLDANVPEWFNRVKVDRLDMESCLRCVLGQSCGYYFEVINRVDPEYAPDANKGEVSPWAIARGFALGEDEAPYRHDDDMADHAQEWKTLRECWITAILERRFKSQLDCEGRAADVRAEAEPLCAPPEIQDTTSAI